MYTRVCTLLVSLFSAVKKVRTSEPTCLCYFRGSSPVLCAKHKLTDVFRLPLPSSRMAAGRGVGLGWVGSRPRLVAYPRSAPPSLRDPTGRPYPGVRSQGLPDC